jgi:excinuclease ABC subunit C
MLPAGKRRKLMPFSIKKIPTKPGIYIFRGKDAKTLYIGKSVNLRLRVRSYFQRTDSFEPKIRQLVPKIRKVEHISTDSELDALILEAYLINKLKPFYNSRLKDGKRYLYIRITNEKFPRILVSRKQSKKKDLFFGPYPSSRTVKDVLRTIRRIFPYCNQKPTAKRRCFYSHIGLCGPCPAQIRKLNKRTQAKLSREYRRNINSIVDLLNGKRPLVEKRLKKQMLDFSDQERFEEAAKVRNQIRKLEYIITHKKTSIGKYLEITSMGNVWQFARIEGYDISNIFGKEATGSMVVFINCEPEKSQYRKFKIRSTNSPNDPKMLKEVLQRRITHTEWDFPNLILVDGGKAQISAALSVLNRNKLDIPVIGLTKRSETIILKDSIKYKEINLPRNSSVLRLLQNIRDEAHRFAKSYHTILRSKKTLNRN